MKTLKLTFILICSLLFANSNLQAQAPEKINYQAVARNLAGVPLVNQTINVKYEIRQGLPTGTVVYAETHTLTTNQFGLFTAQIGGGTPITGTFPGIAWGTSPFYLFVEVDGDAMGVTQLLSVPYALYAKESANGPAGLPGKNSLSLSTLYTGPSCINGGTQIDAGLDDNNDGTLQPLEIDYSYIICNGSNGTNGTNGLPGTNGVDGIDGINGVDGISIDSTINNNDGTFSIYYSNGTSFTTSDLTGPAGTGGTTYFAGNGISLSGDTVTNLGDLDNNPTNEIQILSINATQDTIFLSNGGYAVLPSSTTGLWSTFGGLNIHNNNPNNVGIGTTTPLHKLSVVSNDSVVASFIGTNPNVSAIVVANFNPSAATGIVFFNGVDTTSYIFLSPSNNALTIRNNSLNGNILISADSIIVNQGLILVNQVQNSMYNQTDTIYNYSPSGTIVHVNQGMFLTDSLYVLGNNAANINWVLANDGFGQAKWTDPNLITSGGDQWGSQVVVTDTTLTGTGIAGTPLSVNPNIIPTQTSQLTNNSGFITSPDDADNDPNNEIELPATAVANQVLTWDGSAWVAQNAALGTDSQDLSLAGNTLSLTNDGTPVDLTPFMDNTDAQTLSFVSPNLSILGGNTVNLSALTGPTYTAGAGINLAGNIITNTAPDQTVVITGAGTTNVTSAYPSFIITTNDNDTSATNELQNLSVFNSPGSVTLNISGGNAISFNVDDSPTNELITSFGVNGANLEIIEAGNTWNVPLTSLSSATNAWNLTGNAVTNPATNFIGTTDNIPLNFRVNNTKAGRIDSTNNEATFGYNALLSNTSGAQITAIGANALKNNTTGTENTAVGYNTLANVTTVFGNTAVGSRALSLATTNGNSAVGYGALELNVGGSFNTAMGMFSLRSSTSGFNAAFGYYSLAFNTSGGNNTGMGYNVLGGNTTGSNNTAVGYNSGATNVSGANNTLIGANTDVFTNNLINATAIGANTVVAQSNSLILGNGANVGIGTPTPGAKLDVQNADNNVHAFSSIHTGTNAHAGYFKINNAANNLNAVNATTNGAGAAINASNTYNGANAIRDGIYVTVTGAGGPITTNKAGYFSASGAANNYAAIFDQGNVGIGTGSPSAKLHLEGSLRLNNLSGTAPAIGSVLTSIDAAGNAEWAPPSGAANAWNLVGNVGTTVGTHFVGTGDAQPLMFKVNGNKAGFIDYDGSIANIGFGYQTLNSISSGTYNTAMGYTALRGNTTGNYNTAMGIAALYNNSTGSSNTAIGGSALNGNLTGSFNTAIGDRSMQSVGSGNDNTAVGYLSLQANTNAGQNVAIGRQALQTQSFANGGTPYVTDNVAVGYQALYSNQPTGSGTNALRNIAVGSLVLYSNTTGLENTAIGHSALSSNTTGLRNTTNGAWALYNNTTGSYNVALGYLAGVTFAGANANITGNNNTFIGYASGPGTSTQLTNATAIGADAIVNQSNSLVLGNNANVGIGTGAPSAKLHLEGSLRLNNLSGTAPAIGSVLTSIDAAGNAEWAPPSGAANAWNLTGNAGTNAATNFIGTTDNVALNFRVNNSKAGKIDSLGRNSFFGFLAGANTSGVVNANTAMGFQSLYLNTTGTQNTAMGVEALRNNTGNDNTSIGYTALRENTTGNGNTATGLAAIATNTTGSFNTANGWYALFSNTIGNKNTAYGMQALYSNTSGSWNTAIGEGTLSNNDAGSEGVAIGYQSQYYVNNNTTPWTNTNTSVGMLALRGSGTASANTGLDNTAIGHRSMLNNTSGGGNTANGYQSLYSNTTGSNNIAIGYQSLWSNTSGNANTAIGTFALYANTIGVQNTALGTNSLGNTTNNQNTAIGQNSGASNTIGSNNTFIGVNADATVGNLTNSTAIGAGATVGQSNSLILGSGANVGIGTSTPTAKLDVNGTIVISGANTNELNRAQTGTANLVPIAYGSVGSGAAITNAGTGNWSVVAGGAGQYTITVTGETFVGNSHIMSGTMNGSYGFISLIAFTNNILVQTTNTGGVNQNAAFSFIVYKP